MKLIRDQVRNQVWYKVRHQVWYQLSNKVLNQVRVQVEDSIATGDSL